jgi:ABC-type amino acid transport substrate-binding protein
MNIFMKTSTSIRFLTFCQCTLGYLLFFIFSIGGAAAEADNEKLQVATKPFAPFVILKGDEYIGFSIDLWDAIAKQLDVKYEFIGVKTVGELIQTVSEKKADIGIAGISMTAKREEKIDFSYSFFRAGLQIMILNESDPSLSSSMLDLATIILHPKQAKPVIILLIVFFVLGNIIWFLERHHNPSFSQKYLRGIWDGFWWAAVTLTTVGYGDKTPKRFAGQFFGFLVVLIGCVFFASFTAAITAKLTVQHLHNSIEGIADLIDKRVATVESSTAYYYLQKLELKNVVKYGDIDQAYEALKNQEVEAIVYDSPVLQYYKSQEKKPITKLVGSIFKIENYAIAFPTGSYQYKERINQILLKLQENGDYKKLREKWFGYL